MRPALVVLALVFSVGCSCGGSDGRDGGGADDGALGIDGALGDGSVADAEVDGGTTDPATCEGYARALCGALEACDAVFVYVVGSRERCETHVRAECEHEDSLERTGDLVAARRAYVESLSATDCRWAHDEAAPERPAGLGAAGDACRSSLQCGEAVTADGRTLRMHCHLPVDVAHEPACDAGVCEVPLAEGTPDCISRVGERCDVTLGLACIDAPDDSTPRCAPRPGLAVGETCDPFMFSQCADGLACGPESVCEPQRGNGETCDPGTIRHCRGGALWYCDPETLTCAHIALALEGGACSSGREGPACSRLYDCIDGACVRGASSQLRGEACDSTALCWSLTCTDGVCGGAACE